MANCAERKEDVGKLNSQ